MSRFVSFLTRAGVLSEVPAETPAADATPAPPTTSATPAAAAPKAVAAPVVGTDPDQAKKLAELQASVQKRLIDVMENDGAPLVEELMGTLETLQDSIPDERACFLAALKLLKKRSITVQSILGDYDKCLGVLEENKRLFEADIQKQVDQRVGAKQRAVADYEKAIQAKNEQIATLQQEIADLVVKKDTEQSAVSVERSKIDQFHGTFNVVYQNVRSAVEQQRVKVSQYGEGV